VSGNIKAGCDIIKMEHIIVIGGIGALAYLLLRKSKKDQDPKQPAMKPMLQPTVIVPPVVTPAASSSTNYNVDVGAPSIPQIPTNYKFTHTINKKPSKPKKQPTPTLTDKDHPTFLESSLYNTGSDSGKKLSKFLYDVRTGGN